MQRVKKKIDFYFDRTLANLKQLEKWSSEVQKEISEDLQEKVLTHIKSIETADNLPLDLNYTKLKNKMIISALIGATDELGMDLIEFADEPTPDNPFTMPHDEAIKYLSEKNPSLIQHIEPITADIQKKFFWIKRSTDLRLTEALQKSLIEALEEGSTLNDWRENAFETLDDLGIYRDDWYTELVWRNNTHSAYNSGAYVIQEANKENKPYGLYDAIEDSRITDLCESLDGKVYPLDHDFWKTFMPPNHHNCRSRRIALSDEDVDESNLKVLKKMPKGYIDLIEQAGTFAGEPLSGLKVGIPKRRARVKRQSKKLNETIDKQWKITKESLREIDLGSEFEEEFAKEIENHVLTLANQYPIGYFDRLEIIGKRGDFLGQHTSGIGYKNNLTNELILKAEINLNPKYMKNKKISNITQDYKIIARKMRNKSSTPFFTVSHEYGHFLDRIYTYKMTPGLEKDILEFEGKTISTIAEGIQVSDINNKSISSENSLARTVKRKLMKEYEIKDETGFKEFAVKEFGTYAGSNDEEFFAEAFAQHIHTKEKTDELIKFGEIFEKIIKEVF